MNSVYDDRIFLLSREEAEEIPPKYLVTGFYKNWWLRPNRQSTDIPFVGGDGGSLFQYAYGNHDEFYVRPAILLNGSEYIHKAQDNIIEYLGLEWISLQKYLEKPIILAKKEICRRCFDSNYKVTNYGASELRFFLLKWLAEQEKTFIWEEKPEDEYRRCLKTIEMLEARVKELKTKIKK